MQRFVQKALPADNQYLLRLAATESAGSASDRGVHCAILLVELELKQARTFRT
jgi:hypothetical protein